MPKGELATNQGLPSIETGEPKFPTTIDNSFLSQETMAMENARRLEEQKGHRRYARVNQNKDRQIEEQNISAENQMGLQGPKEHPFLSDNQRFDGIDPNVSPAPDINTDARREFDNERREQEKEKQLRLGNELQNQYRSTPKPSPNS